MDNFSDQPVLEPLSFAKKSTSSINSGSLKNVLCLMCDQEFNLPGGFDSFKDHMKEKHSLIIGKLQEIADLPKYVEYWRKRIEEGLVLHEICKTFTDQPEDQSSTENSHFYLLDEELEEDRQLRSKLHFETLQERLDHQQKDRDDDSFSRTCLFCTRHFHFNRSSLLKHMAEYHHFIIDHPDNLVYTNELLAILEEKLHNLQCLYCEKTFKDPFVLKEHMRKKRHRRLRLSNYVYRKFFIIYPETAKTSADQQSACGDDDVDYDDDDEDDDVIDDEDDAHDSHIGEDTEGTDESSSIDHNDWNDWVAVYEPEMVCLFCTNTLNNITDLLEHMKDVHRFDMNHLTTSNKMKYYQQVKLVNYIRRQVHYNTCISCSEKFDSRELLLQHLHSTDHSSQLPEKSVWNQPQYFFPTYENDSLLCALMENDDGLPDADEEVIAEDLPDGVREYRMEDNSEEIINAQPDGDHC